MSMLIMIGDALGISDPVWSTGTPAVFDADTSDYVSVAKLSATQAIVCYRDGGNSSYGTYCLLGVSGATITPGTPGVFESANTNNITVCALSSTQALVCYQDAGNSNAATYCLLGISGSTVTPETPGTFDTVFNSVVSGSVAALSASQALVCYRGPSNYGTHCIFDISGSTVTPGTPGVFNSATTSAVSLCALSSSQAIVCYQNGGDGNQGYCCALDISGSTVTPATPAEFDGNVSSNTSVCRISASKAIVCYRDAINDYGICRILDISGSTITPGSPTTFLSSLVQFCKVDSADASLAIVCYQDYVDARKGYFCELAISGSTITAGTPVKFLDRRLEHPAFCMLSATSGVIAYKDYASTGDGTAVMLTYA